MGSATWNDLAKSIRLLTDADMKLIKVKNQYADGNVLKTPSKLKELKKEVIAVLPEVELAEKEVVRTAKELGIDARQRYKHFFIRHPREL